MTYRQLFANVRGNVARLDIPTLEYEHVVSMAKRAVRQLCSETPVGARIHSMPVVAGLRDYTLQPHIGRILRVEYQLGSFLERVGGWQLEDHLVQASDTSSLAGDTAIGATQIGNTLRVTPQPSAGTFLIHHGNAPSDRLRESADETFGETCAANGTVTTFIVSAFSAGTFFNLAGDTDELNGCEVECLSTPRGIGYVTNYNEVPSNKTFTFAPAFASPTLLNDRIVVRDSLEVPRDFADGVVAFVSAYYAARDKSASAWAKSLMEQWTANLAKARSRTYGSAPFAPPRLRPPSQSFTPGMGYGRW